MNSERTHLMIGLPETGKTTFLAAFWCWVSDSRTNGTLHADALPADRQYLNEIARVWLQGNVQPRTNTGSVFQVSMTLSDPSTHQQSNIVFPDLSGELFETQWSKRQWDTDYDRLVRDAHGLILFVHPDRLQPGYTIPEVEAGAALIRGANASANAPVAESQGQTPWEPRLAPTQVVLIDLLQFILDDPCFVPALRVSTVISAWDLVKAEAKTPTRWLSDYLPLLDQFILTNRARIENRTFGISAQGGDYANSEARKTLLARNALDRIEAVDDAGMRSDITAPIRWLMTAD